MPLFSPGNNPGFIGFIKKDFNSQTSYFKETDWVDRKVKYFNVQRHGCD